MRSSTLAALIAAVALAGPALAKLPPPSDEAKAKSAEAAAKTAWANKVSAHKQCQIEDRLVQAYHTSVKAAGKDAPASVATPACAEPGPAPADAKPLEAAGAHSPAATATSPPSGKATAAELAGAPKK